MTFKTNKSMPLIIMVMLLCACSNDEHYGQGQGQSIYNIPLPPLITTDDLIDTIGKYAKDKYEDECIREVYYYCPPLDEVHRAKAVVDTCRENKVLSISDCEEVLECIPTLDIIEVKECVAENGMIGFQNVYCYKGFYEYGECDPCEEEICDGIDNDCDGSTDEGEYPCSTDCGDGTAICLNGELAYCNAPTPEEEICDGIDNNCDGNIDEGQLNKCGKCGPEPLEMCDGYDNDCDGLTDEDLLQECSTACEVGIDYCVNGQWYCTATPPSEEICDGFDNDCDGQIDEELDCLCKLSDVGKLLPCKENPLVCGEGYKTCECTDETCTEFKMSDCLAVCHWFPAATPPGSVCDEYLGEVKPEECNNHDDNCNQLVDENLIVACYDGPIETIDVGICKAGEMVCSAGQWGHYEGNILFVPNMCLGQVTPEPEDVCNGADSNCDGMIDEDKELAPTDILFVVDMSGSMDYEINAVFVALQQFAAYHSDADVLKWGILLIAVDGPGPDPEYMHLIANLTDFQSFVNNFSLVLGMNFTGGLEMSYDAIYMAIHNIVAPGNLTYDPSKPGDIQWKKSTNGYAFGYVGESVPSMNNFEINWREDANRVVILFTDEMGQSYTEPPITTDILVKAVEGALKLKIFVFSLSYLEALPGVEGSWGPITLNNMAGKFFSLTNDAVTMYNNLLEILDETACEN